MINLIKNELSKIFHKKAIYVLMIIIVGIIGLDFLLYLVSYKYNVFAPLSYSIVESNLANYDLENEDQIDAYISDKTYLDVLELQKKYKYNDWQYYAIENDLYDSMYCINNAEVRKDNENLKECEEEKTLLLKKIDEGDWKYFVELQRGEDKFYNELLDYRIKKKIPFSNNEDSLFVDNYSSLYYRYNEIKSDKSYKTYEEELGNKLTEKEYFETKYTIENDIKVLKDYDVQTLLRNTFGYTIFFIIVSIVLISSSIVSEEFNKGTIKQLLLRPYSRTKILLSKYLVCVIVFILLMLFYLVASTIIYGFLNGWSSLGVSIPIYNYATGVVKEYSIWNYIFLYSLSLLPCYLILMSISFFIGALFASSSLAIAFSFVFYIASSIVGSFANSIKYSIIKIIPSLNWDLSCYLFGGMSPYKYCNFTVSLIVDLCTLGLLIGISIYIFNKKEIKNQ